MRCGFVLLCPSRSLVRARQFAAIGAPTVFLVARSRTVVDPALPAPHHRPRARRCFATARPLPDLHQPRLPPAAGRSSSDGVPFPQAQYRLPTAPARFPPRRYRSTQVWLDASRAFCSFVRMQLTGGEGRQSFCTLRGGVTSPLRSNRARLRRVAVSDAVVHFLVLKAGAGSLEVAKKLHTASWPSPQAKALIESDSAIRAAFAHNFKVERQLKTGAPACTYKLYVGFGNTERGAVRPDDFLLSLLGRLHWNAAQLAEHQVVWLAEPPSVVDPKSIGHALTKDPRKPFDFAKLTNPPPVTNLPSAVSRDSVAALLSLRSEPGVATFLQKVFTFIEVIPRFQPRPTSASLLFRRLCLHGRLPTSLSATTGLDRYRAGSQPPVAGPQGIQWA